MADEGWGMGRSRIAPPEKSDLAVFSAWPSRSQTFTKRDQDQLNTTLPPAYLYAHLAFLPFPPLPAKVATKIVPAAAGRSIEAMDRDPEVAPTSTMAKAAPAARFSRVCVFCGSSPGKKAAYQLAAVQLGQLLVEHGIGLVYGGGSMGLMGLVSRTVHGGGGHVIGVVPNTLLPRELIGETPGEVRAVSGMHQRKAEMARRSDAFVALPGGYGTLEELLEVITWAQLGIHDKPVSIWTKFVEFVMNLVGFCDEFD
jgi:uncharacterized protein (TIGR00730 family)